MSNLLQGGESLKMSNYIKQVNVNLWNGIFLQKITFINGLNLISGTNGTGKTQLLNYIQNNKNNSTLILFDNETSKEITVFSPKRNAEKQLVEQIQSQLGLSKRQKKQLINNIQQNINDVNFQTINSIAFYLKNESEVLVNTANKTREEATNIVKEEYQKIFNQLFNYKLIYSWDSVNARPQAGVIKNNHQISFTDLSAGENALLSLVCAIYFSRDDTDVYLIDEPEVHLNWSLEEKLFKFLYNFCHEQSKQIITVTHSRVIALDEFKKRTKFLSWENGKVIVNNDLTEQLIKDLAGDTVKIIEGITSNKKLVYVEDESQRVILDQIAKKLNLNIHVQSVGGGSEYVKSLSKAFMNIPVNNVYFLIDGDNKPLNVSELSEFKNLIQLKKYCIENYLLDSTVLNLYSVEDWESKIKNYINSIDIKSRPAIKPIQVALEKSATASELMDYIDGSEVFNKLVLEKKLDKKKKYELIREILQKIPDSDLITKYFPELRFLED